MPWDKKNLPPSVKGMDLSEHEIDIFIKAANAALKEYGDDVRAIKVGIAAAKGDIKHNDEIPGGLGDNETLSDLAKKHDVSIEQIKKEFAMGIKVEREHTSSEEKAAEIALDHLTEHGDYYSKLKVAEMHMNSLDEKGEIVYIRHCKAGLATYPKETILIQDECLKKMMPTMAGVPIFIDHVDEVDMNDADGFVTECIYNTLDGCYWAKCIITDFNAFNKVQNGWGASNAYKVVKYGNGGLYHGARYDREILEGEYNHLAIVTDPRYNESMILKPQEYKEYNEQLAQQLDELQNSLTEKEKDEMNEKSLFNRLADMFKNAADDEKDEKEKDKEENACKKNEEEADDKDKKIKELEEKLNEATEKMKEYENKKNEEDAEMKKKEEEKEKEEDEKHNSYFNSLQNKFYNGASTDDKIVVHTKQAGIDLGKELF